MEIERKYLVKELPEDLENYRRKEIEQAYLCTEPVVRVRRKDDDYILTFKGKGLLAREEHEFPLSEEKYLHLLAKADGHVISKTRYLIPIEGTELVIELDVFHGDYDGLLLAEVEFSSEEEAYAFQAPVWFGEDVTFSGRYQNSRLAMLKDKSEL